MSNLIIAVKYFTVCLMVTALSSPAITQTIVDTPLADLTTAQKAWLLNDTARAWDLYLQGLQKSAEKTIPAYNLAFLAFINGKLELTAEYLRIALSHNPQYGPALLLQARLDWHQNKMGSALAGFNAALKYHPQPYLVVYYRALFYQSQNNLNKAAEDFKTAIRANDKFSPAYAPLAQILMSKKQFKEAGEVLEKGLLTSYDAEIILSLAQYYENIKAIEKSAYYYRLFLELFPRHPSAPKARLWLDNHEVRPPDNFGFAKPELKPKVLDFPVGENYVYNVHWGPLKVGELNTVIAERLLFQGKPAYKVIFSLDSNPALEFIASLHSDYITIIDAVTKQTMQHFLHVRENRLIYEKVYDFHRDSNKFICRVINEDGSIDRLEKWLPENTIDGTSILFYARQVVKNRCSERVLTIIDENFVISDLVYENQREPIAVRGRYESAIRICGENHYKGIVGFTGKFRGWFRDNPAYLPIQADFEIWVGRILITMASEEEQREHRYAR